MTTVRETVNRIRTVLGPIYSPGEIKAITSLIFRHLLNWPYVKVILSYDEQIGDVTTKEIDSMLDRLSRHEPIQYVLGEARFYGLDLKVTPAVLIPRQETEGLVEMIVRDAGDREDLRVLDVCTGSGCIALALARNLRFPQITAIDISPDALGVAKENAARLRAKISFLTADALQLSQTLSENGLFDIIVSNPPYVLERERSQMEANVLDYEPEQAIFVPDSDPLRFYRPIAEYAAKALTGGGRLYFEINPFEADSIADMLKSLGFTDIEITLDMEKRRRFASCTHPDTDSFNS